MTSARLAGAAPGALISGDHVAALLVPAPFVTPFAERPERPRDDVGGDRNDGSEQTPERKLRRHDDR
jgi:hypothetical protein